MNSSSKISVLINTCDKYEDVWKPFFHFFQKHWSFCPYEIYLNTESKKYVDEEIKVHTINVPHGKNYTWSQRLKHTLKQIDTEYVLFMLEDFFFLDDVDQGEIDRCFEYMQKDKKVICLNFANPRKLKLNPSPLSGYGEMPEHALWVLNCQAGLWRRKDFIKVLNPYESPWQFEEQGTQRAGLYGKKFLRPYEYNAFHYHLLPEEGGYGTQDGKWLQSNIALFEKEGISVDFEKLGFCDYQKIKNRKFPPVKINFKWKWMYLLYGGYFEKQRMPILSQMKMALSHPKHFMKAMGRKIKFLFQKEIWSKIMKYMENR